jgi:hypothetical protein
MDYSRLSKLLGNVRKTHRQPTLMPADISAKASDKMTLALVPGLGSD